MLDDNRGDSQGPTATCGAWYVGHKTNGRKTMQKVLQMLPKFGPSYRQTPHRHMFIPCFKQTEVCLGSINFRLPISQTALDSSLKINHETVNTVSAMEKFSVDRDDVSVWELESLLLVDDTIVAHKFLRMSTWRGENWSSGTLLCFWQHGNGVQNSAGADVALRDAVQCRGSAGFIANGMWLERHSNTRRRLPTMMLYPRSSP